MSGIKVEMFWDCKYCDKKGILGRYRTCPECGKTRGEGVKFYLPDNLDEYKLSKEESAKISNRADWYCEYCDALNKAEDYICHACGSYRSESKKDYFDLQEDAKRRDQIKKKQEQLKQSKQNIEDNLEELVELQRSALERVKDYDNQFSSTTESYDDGITNKCNSKSSQIHKWFKTLSICLVSLFAILGFFFLFKPTTSEVSVIDKSWERSIAIEESRWVEESGWSLPGDAKLLHSAIEIRTYEQVFDHYETKTVQKSRQVQDGYDISYSYRDLGNGYSEQVEHKTPRYRTEYYTETVQEPVYRSEPVYDTKYYYEVEKWIKVRSVDTNGNDNEPYWGDVVLSEKEREGHKMEDYDITVIMKDKEKEFDLEFAEWNQIELNDNIKIKTNTLGMCKIVEFDK